MIFSVPSKTFLFGEYGILKNSPAAIITTNPRFELQVVDKPGELLGIHSESPAGNYYKTHYEYFKKYTIMFRDPWNGAGGFGASSAQFGLLYALKHHLTSNDLNSVAYPFLNDMRSMFRDMSWRGVGLPPSGGDLIAQWAGGITAVDFSNETAESLNWPFENLSFVIIKTPNKMATHIHLQDIEDLMDQEYALIAKRGIKALKNHSQQNNDEQNFLLAVQAQFQLLSRNELVAPETRTLIDLIRQSGLVQTSKGCGAMGSDVVLSIVRNKNLSSFLDWCKQNDLQVAGTNKDISGGLKIDEKWEERNVTKNDEVAELSAF